MILRDKATLHYIKALYYLQSHSDGFVKLESFCLSEAGLHYESMYYNWDTIIAVSCCEYYCESEIFQL